MVYKTMQFVAGCSPIVAGVMFRAYTLRKLELLFPNVAHYGCTTKYCGQTITVTADGTKWAVYRSLEGLSTFYSREDAINSVFGDSIITSDVSIAAGAFWSTVMIYEPLKL